MDTSSDDACAGGELPAEDVALNDACHFDIGGFTPIVEWDVLGRRPRRSPSSGTSMATGSLRSS